MMTNLNHTQEQESNVDADIKRILAVYSETDREVFSYTFLKLLRSLDIVKLLDENKAAGPSSLQDVLHLCIRLGKIDSSLAWIVGVSNSAWSTRSCFRSLTPSSAMEHNKILSMVLGRPGILKKEKATNRYLLNGEWRYASGWQYSSFFFCLAMIENTAPPDIRMIAVPAEQLELIDNWHATGLRGTQSVTIRANNIEIPDNCMEDYSRILSGENRLPSHLINGRQQASYSGLFTGVLMNCLLGSMLGATEAGLEYVATAVVAKRPVAGSTYASMNDSGAIRAELGRLRSTLDLYKRAAEYNADVIDNVAHNPEMHLTTQERVDNRGRATQIMRGCVNIVQDLLWIYGSSGLDKGNPLERIWRDVNVGARHGGFTKFVPEEAVGLAFMGQDPRILTQMF